jgi:hypothetical protein
MRAAFTRVNATSFALLKPLASVTVELMIGPPRHLSSRAPRLLEGKMTQSCAFVCLVPPDSGFWNSAAAVDSDRRRPLGTGRFVRFDRRDAQIGHLVSITPGATAAMAAAVLEPAPRQPPEIRWHQTQSVVCAIGLRACRRLATKQAKTSKV